MAQNPPKPDGVRVENPIEQHPAMRLFGALSTLRNELTNHRMFQSIIDRRAKARRVHDNLLDVASQIAMNDANRLIVEGTPPMQAMGQCASERAELAAEPFPSNEPEDFLDHPRRILANLRDGAECGLQALREEGAKVLDSTLNAGDSPWSVQCHTKLKEVSSVAWGLAVGIENLNMGTSDDVQAMTELAEWFDDACAEFAAVMELRGTEPRAGETIQEPTQKKAMSLEQVRQTAEARVRAHGWPVYRKKPSIAALAKRIRCSHCTLTKALGESPRLRQAYLNAGGSLDGDDSLSDLQSLIQEQTKDDKSHYA